MVVEIVANCEREVRLYTGFLSLLNRGLLSIIITLVFVIGHVAIVLIFVDGRRAGGLGRRWVVKCIKWV